MEDAFFASVLKKWADTSQQVVDLKKQLDEVEKERDAYKTKAAVYENLLTPKQSPTQTVRCDQVMPLQEAGDRFEKARWEYQKLRQELQTASNERFLLTQEVERLRQEYVRIQTELLTTKQQCVAFDSECANLRQENDTFKKTISDLMEKLQQAEEAHISLQAQNVIPPSFDTQQIAQLQQRMSSLELELQQSQSSTRTLDIENTTLRGDLDITREALLKTKESNKNLLDTISQLSRIARQVTRAPEAGISHQQEQLSAGVQGVPFPQTTMAALITRKRYQSQPIQRTLRLPSVSEAKPTPKVEPKVENDSSFNDSTIVADGDHPVTPMPTRRLQPLATLPDIIPNININEEDNKFTRSLTSAAIGGSIQSLIVRVTSSATELAKGRNIEEYLCPRLDHNPWCPSTPGQHGFMFVGLGREKTTYEIPRLRNLFVGLVKQNQKEERYFRYLGVYRVSRVEALKIEEWQTLHTSVQMNYVQATKEKNKDPRTKHEITDAYNRGELTVPCVQLQCVDFDEELYAGLLTFRSQHKVERKYRLAKRTRDEETETVPSPHKRSSRIRPAQ